MFLEAAPGMILPDDQTASRLRITEIAKHFAYLVLPRIVPHPGTPRSGFARFIKLGSAVRSI